MDRSRFLAGLREALAGVAEPGLPAQLPPTPASGDGRAFERFADEIERVGGTARRLTREKLSDAVAEAAREARTAVVAGDLDPLRPDVEAGLAAAGCAATEPSREGAAGADLGVTGAVLGVASSGSVLIRTGPDSPRAASLLPAAHLVLLPEERLVPGFEELFAAMPEHAAESPNVVLVTGPSRTADIEMTIVRGVHGPAKVTVLVLA